MDITQKKKDYQFYTAKYRMAEHYWESEIYRRYVCRCCLDATQTVEIKTKPAEQFAYYKELLDYVDRYAEGTAESVNREPQEKEKSHSPYI